MNVAVERFFDACRGRELEALFALNELMERTLERYAPGWCKPSADEAVLVASAPWGPNGTPMSWAEALRADLACELSLPVSVGIAATRFAARVCARMARPSGILMWMEGHEDSLLGGLPVEELDELRDEQLTRLRAEGVYTLEDLAELEPRQARSLMGTDGERLLGLVRGADRLSVSSLGGRMKDATRLLSRRVARRLHRARRKARAVELRILYEDGVFRERYALLPHATAQPEEILVATERLFEVLATRPLGVSGLTLSATGLVAVGEQLELFPAASPREIAARLGRPVALEDVDLTDRIGGAYSPQIHFGGKTHEDDPYVDGDCAPGAGIRGPWPGRRR
ncbi:MAG TPA: hypothetical protein VLK65_25755 [Vicinamibacteria bacterium]|nr:hypothetical protein [Vicinamibacteria bacterium]